MAKSNEIDMLHGPLFMKILLFTLPLAASSVLQQLFNSIDVAVVGHFASSQALAAVGSNAPVISLIINLFLGVSMGANVVISNHIGQNDDEKIKQAVATAGMVAVVGGLLLMFIGVAVAKPILTLMGTPPDVLPLAILYLRIYFLGMPFFMMFNFGSAILRSLGDTRRPLYILVAAGIVNTVLNLVFVIVFNMGVAGVAIATGIANMVSAMLIIRLLMMEKEPIRLHINNIKVKWAELKPMLMIGVPAGLQGMVFSFSNVLVQSAINSHSRLGGGTELRILLLLRDCGFRRSCHHLHRTELWRWTEAPRDAHILDMHGHEHCGKRSSERTLRVAIRLLPRLLLQRPRGEGVRHNTHGNRACLPVYSLQLRDFSLGTEGNGQIDAAYSAHNLRHMPAKNSVGVCGVPHLALVRHNNACVSYNMVYYRHFGVHGVLSHGEKTDFT